MNGKHYASVALALCLGACSTPGRLSSGAADLDQKYISVDAQNAAQASGQKRQYLGTVAGDSIEKCRQFSLSLIGSDTWFNTSADVASTIASAGGTLFPAVATVHAISAVGSVINGTKTAVDTDMWAKQPISNLLAAIGNTYNAAMKQYLTNLEGLDESKIIVSEQVDEIMSIHSACNLASAQTAIQSVVQSGSSQTPSTSGNPPTPPGGNGTPPPKPGAKAFLSAPLPASQAATPVFINPYGAWR